MADRREFFNDSAAGFNARIRQLPYTAIAGMMGDTPLEMHKVPENEKVPVDVKFCN